MLNPPASPPGDFGSQGATGEGVFGTFHRIRAFRLNHRNVSQVRLAKFREHLKH
jgi:hypothetical protein